MTLTVQCKSCVDQIQQIARYFKLFTQFLLILGKSCMAGCYSNSKTEKRHPCQMNLTSSQMGTNNFIGCFILLAVTYKTYFDVKLYERYRSSRSQMFFKIVVLRNFEIFTGKHLCWSLQTCNFIKKRLQHKNGFFYRTFIGVQVKQLACFSFNVLCLMLMEICNASVQQVG